MTESFFSSTQLSEPSPHLGIRPFERVLAHQVSGTDFVYIKRPWRRPLVTVDQRLESPQDLVGTQLHETEGPADNPVVLLLRIS